MAGGCDAGGARLRRWRVPRWAPNSAPDGSYARRRLFDRNAAGLPPVRAISDLP